MWLAGAEAGGAENLFEATCRGRFLGTEAKDRGCAGGLRLCDRIVAIPCSGRWPRSTSRSRPASACSKRAGSAAPGRPRERS